MNTIPLECLSLVNEAEKWAGALSLPTAWDGYNWVRLSWEEAFYKYFEFECLAVKPDIDGGRRCIMFYRDDRGGWNWH